MLHSIRLFFIDTWRLLRGKRLLGEMPTGDAWMEQEWREMERPETIEECAPTKN